MSRSVLPIWDEPASTAPSSTTPRTRGAVQPIQPLAHQLHANVLVILLDDVGFGAASVFGGPPRRTYR